MLKDGYYFKHACYLIFILCFIYDAPARQFPKCLVSHTGYSRCEMCMQCGIYEKTIIFPDINASLETDGNFSLMTDSNHHKSLNPLA